MSLNRRHAHKNIRVSYIRFKTFYNKIHNCLLSVSHSQLTIQSKLRKYNKKKTAVAAA